MTKFWTRPNSKHLQVNKLDLYKKNTNTHKKNKMNSGFER